MQESVSQNEPAPTANSAPHTTGPEYDPLVRWLTIGIFIVIILWLAGVVSAFIFGMFNISGAPRTEIEHELAYYSALTQSGKANSQTFALYVDSLMRAGQLSKADDAIAQALKTAKTGRSYLYAEQAQLYLAEKKYQAASSTADTAMAEAEKELKAYIANNIANNRKADAGAVMPDSYSTAALAKARALLALNDYAGAIKAFDAELKVTPSDSDVHVARGQAKLHLGDKAGAAADFREALKYIPDYQPALDGLKQIGASK